MIPRLKTSFEKEIVNNLMVKLSVIKIKIKFQKI